MKTFRMKIVKDKAQDWQDQIQEICSDMRSRGLYPQGWSQDGNYFYIGGNYNCDCSHKFDKAYCDNACK